MAIHQENVNYSTNFSPFGSLFWLVLVVTFGVRSTTGAVVGATAYSLMDKLILQGTFLGWILRDPERIPGFFPVSPKWRFILFGLGTINYAKHPEGIIEYSKARTQARRAERAARRAARSAPADEPDIETSRPVEEASR